MNVESAKVAEFFEEFSKLYAEELSPNDTEDIVMDCMDILSAEDVANLIKFYKEKQGYVV